jgi:DNA invertase Pin-like site-specific DNA recombinase
MIPASVHPVVLYARVSQARDERSKSVDDQLAELRTWAKREGWPIVGEYRDDDVSASRYSNGKARPGWEQTMAIVASGRVKALLLWELSRATRDKAVSAALETACAARGVRIGYSGRLHDPATADGEFAVGLDALLAARESAMTSERVRRAAEHRATRGQPHAALPWGYRRVFDPATGRVVAYEIDPERGPIVQEMVRRVLNYESANAIAADLNKRKIPTAAAGKCTRQCGCRATNSGKPNPNWEGTHTRFSGRWTGANLSKHILKPALAGLRTRNGEVLDVKATWPPLISVDDHHRLRALYASPERDKWRNTTGRREVKHLGTGLFWCGREGCDGRMRVVRRHDRSDYACRSCMRTGRRQAVVDDLVQKVVIARLARPDIMELLAGPDTDEQRQRAASEVIRLRAEEADMRRLVREGRLSPLDLADWRDGWTPRLEAAERAARPPQLPSAVSDMVGSDAEQRWAKASIANRRAVVDVLLVVMILPMGRNRELFDSSIAGDFDGFFPEAGVGINWRR